MKMKEIATAADEVDLNSPDDVRRQALDLALRQLPVPWVADDLAVRYSSIVKLLEGADQ